MSVMNEAINLLKSAKDQLSASKAQRAIHEKIQEAERAIQLGHAEMGQSLGFQLCYCS